MVRRALIYIAILLSSFQLWAQDPFIELDVDPKIVEVGQPFTVTIKTNSEGHIEMNLPDDFIQSGPRQSGMSSSLEIIDGKQVMVRFSFQSFTGYLDQEGTYLFGPIKVKDKKKEYKSEAYSVKVIKPRNMISEDPGRNMHQLIFGIIQQSKKEIYEGEPVVLEGKVYSQVDVLQVEDYTPFSLNGTEEIHPMANSDRITTSFEVVNGKKLLTFKIGQSVVFPDKVGEFTIKPFQTVLVYNDPRSIFPERLKVSSNESKIKVKPLPKGAPRSFIGAVGKFKVSSRIKNPNIKQGEVIELKVKIEGHGNLQNILHPKLNLPEGLTLYGDPEVKDTISYCTLGTEGSKTFNYFIRVDVAGEIKIPPITISYFNPKTGKYETSDCKVISLNIQANEEETPIEEEYNDEQMIATDLKPFLTKRQGSSSNGVGWIAGWGKALLLSPILLGLVGGLFVRIKKTKELENQAGYLHSMNKSNALLELSALDEQVDNEQKAIELSKIIIEYLANHFNLDIGEITRANLSKKVPNELAEETYLRIKSLFDELEAMKYGAMLDNEMIDHLKDEANHIIENIS